MKEFMGKTGVLEVLANMCRFGMTTKYRGEEGKVSKATRFLTSSPECAKRLGLVCDQECKQDKHIAIWGARAREAQRYPPALCRAVVEGVKAEKIVSESNLCEIDVDLIIDLAATEGIEDAETRHEGYLNWAEAWDDVTFKALDPVEVSKARAKEMEYVRGMKVYEVVDIRECLRMTGRPPIKSRWIDINKGDDKNRNYRSRWVAKQFKTNNDFELFAATPPLDALRYVISTAASMKNGSLMSNDVSRAYFYAPATRNIFVELPEEAGHGPGKCARLLKSLYGTRDAATNWSKAYTDILESIGFEVGVSNPCLFKHKSRSITTLVHGDDFLSAASDEDLEWMKSELGKNLEIKTQKIGRKEKTQQMTFLGRVITWEESGIKYEADPRHAEIVIQSLGLAGGKGAATPGSTTKLDVRDESASNPLMAGQDATNYRAVTARLNFLAQDRTDIQHATKEVSRYMSAPRAGDMEGLKHIGKYLLRRPRATYMYKFQAEPSEFTVYSDTDWAGCRSTRKSTSGGIVMHGEHFIKSWSRQQNLVSLSSAEAELYGLVKASSKALGCKAMAHDFGHRKNIRLYADASAALGIVHRKGLGKVRHIDTNTLWVQQAACTKRIQYLKVAGTVNPADALTKHLTEVLREQHMKKIHVSFDSGRAAAAPELCR